MVGKGLMPVNIVEFLINDNDNLNDFFYGSVRCPVRGCHSRQRANFHILDIGIVDGETQPHYRQTRGAQAVVSLDGECGHKFDLVLGFHKGATYVAIDKLKDSDGRSCSRKYDGEHVGSDTTGKYCLCGQYKF